MNVLSLFDGMSCGQIALQRAGIPVTNYFASEIDKYAIHVTMANWPNTVQLGSVVDVRADQLPDIDLLIGGSPCQGFSFAGKGLNFEDPRSKLFFEFVRLLKECAPTYFLLENVKMKKEHQDVISQYLGCEPVVINSALVSAQNRVRLYWTNIPFDAPADRGIVLKDILQSPEDVAYGAAMRGRNIVDGKRKDYFGAPTVQRLETNYVEKSNCLTSVQKDTLVFCPKSHDTKEGATIFVGGIEQCRRLDDGKTLAENFSIGYRVWSDEGKFPTVRTADVGMVSINGYSPICQNQIKKNAKKEDGKSNCMGTGTQMTAIGTPVLQHENQYRKLSPIECERLQTVPDNYTASVSTTQRYKMLGNGWTVDVIAHIFKSIAQ